MKSELLTLLFTAIFGTVMAQPKPENRKTDCGVEIIRYQIPMDQHEMFEKAYADAGKFLDASPVCLGYQIIKGHEEKDHYIVIIHWTSVSDHLNVFRKSEQFASFFNLVKPFYGAIQEMSHYDLTPTLNYKP